MTEFSISEGISWPWPDEVQVAAAAFRQGDLIDRPPFFYAANTDHAVWDLTRQAADADDEGGMIEIHEDDRPAYGIITTQSCDLTEDDAAKPKKPWFQAAPLISIGALDKGLLHAVSRGKAKYLYLVSSPEVGDWVADLRIEMPLEKSWLVGRSAIAGFANLEEYQRFTRHLGHLRARPAIEPGICKEIVIALRGHLEQRAADQPHVLDGVDRVMLRLIGERTHLSAVEVVVVPAEGAPDSIVRDLFDQWYDDFSPLAFEHGVALLPVLQQAQFTPDEYERLVVVDLDDLSPQGE